MFVNRGPHREDRRSRELKQSAIRSYAARQGHMKKRRQSQNKPMAEDLRSALATSAHNVVPLGWVQEQQTWSSSKKGRRLEVNDEITHAGFVFMHEGIPAPRQLLSDIDKLSPLCEPLD